MTENAHRLGDGELVGDIVDAVMRGDWSEASSLTDEADARQLGPPAKFGEEDPQPENISIGDEFTAVVVHPNKDDERDPVAKVGGKTTYLRFEEKGSSPVGFGTAVRARMADKQPGHNLATALEVLD